MLAFKATSIYITMRKWYTVYNASICRDFPFDDHNRDNTILGVKKNILKRHACRVEMLGMNRKGGSGQCKKHKRYSL